MDAHYLRGKAFNIALLTAGYAVQAEIEQACEKGREAIDQAVALDSAGAITNIYSCSPRRIHAQSYQRLPLAPSTVTTPNCAGAARAGT
jgi:hypothetical protein